MERETQEKVAKGKERKWRVRVSEGWSERDQMRDVGSGGKRCETGRKVKRDR